MVTPQEVLDFFKENGQLATFKKRSIITSQDSPLEYVYLITKGHVKVYDIDQVGDERILSIFAPGHIFPVTWLTTPPNKESIFFFAAMSHAECYRVPVSVVEELLDRDNDACRFVIDLLVKSYINHTSRIQNLQSPHAGERIKFILHYLAERLGTSNDGIATIPVVITHQEIADLTGVARETVTIELSRLARQDIYHRSKGLMYINMQKLNAKNMPKIYGLQSFNESSQI